MNALDFSGKTVLVVGGTSGIGNGIAHAFLDHGATVHVWGTRASAADYDGAEGSDLGGLHFASMDVSDLDRLEAYEPPFDRLDILVQSQGTVLYGRREFSREGWDQVMAVNLGSMMVCATKFKPMLAATQGSLIFISSVSAYHANKGNPAYAASKAALVNLTRTLGEAWAPEGIRVNGIAPGLVDTKLTKVTTRHPRRYAETLAQIPLARMGTPAELGKVALFFASSMASYVVGQTLIVDGGLTNG